MKYQFVLTLVLIYACSSCSVKVEQDSSGFNYQQYFENIEKTDNCLGEGEGFPVLGKRMDASIKAPLDTLGSVAALKKIYYKAVDKQAAVTTPKNGRCIDTNIAIKERTLQRLVKLNNEESINVLIDIYSDKNISFTRNEAKSFARFLTEAGPSILPKLEPIKDQRPAIGPIVIQNLKNR